MPKNKMKVISRKGRRVIAGYGSYVMVDHDRDLVTKEALESGLKSFMKNEEFRNIMWSHESIQIGKVLEKYGQKKTHVDDKGLFIVAEIRNDIESADMIWEAILDGDLNAFSIGFEPLERVLHENEKGEPWTEIKKINLLEVSVCKEPSNALSRYLILSKSKNVLENEKGEKMTENKTETKEEQQPIDVILQLVKELSEEDLTRLKSELMPEDEEEEEETEVKEKEKVSISEIQNELKRLNELGEEIKGSDLSELARLITSFETGQSVKAYPLPKNAEGANKSWHEAVTKSVDELYAKIDKMAVKKSTDIEELKKMVITKTKEAEAAQEQVQEAQQETQQAKAETVQAKEQVQEVTQTANADRKIIEEVQSTLKQFDDTFKKFDDRLNSLEKVKVEKTKVNTESAEKLYDDYRPSNVVEEIDSVEIMVE